MNADMQRRRCAHRMADDMRLVDLQRIHQRDDVVARDVLAVARRIGRHIRRRITALAVGDAAMGAREVAKLRLPGAVIARIFVDENHGTPGPDFLVIELGPVGRRYMRHRRLLQPDGHKFHLHTNEMLVALFHDCKRF